MAYACLVIADETIFVAGGQRSKNNYLPTLSKEVYILDISLAGLSTIKKNLYKIKLGDEDWTRGQDMPKPRTRHTCSPISTQSSGTKIVAVGGSEGR